MVVRLKLIFTTASIASKNDAYFKSGQKRPEINHLTLLVWIRDTLSRLYYNEHFWHICFRFKYLIKLKAIRCVYCILVVISRVLGI